MGLALTRKVGSQSHFDFICLRAQSFPAAVINKIVLSFGYFL